jgi:hypothetical protein
MSTSGCAGFGTDGNGSGASNTGCEAPLRSGDPSCVSAISTRVSVCLDGVIAGGGVGGFAVGFGFRPREGRSRSTAW